MVFRLGAELTRALADMAAAEDKIAQSEQQREVPITPQPSHACMAQTHLGNNPSR